MKKLLSVLCMALIAGGILFTSCGKNFTITVNANNDAWGTVNGGGSYAEGAEVTLTALPNNGYYFVEWNDGVATNPRVITVSANETYTAKFAAIPAEPTVNVNFGGSAWSAGEITGRYWASDKAWDVYSAKVSGQYPRADVCMTTTTVGQYTSQANSQNGKLTSDEFQWVEYYEKTYLQDPQGLYYGDWWAKSATVNVTAFDATALTVSSNVSATMFDAWDALTTSTDGSHTAVGVEAAATAPMTITIDNVKMTAAKGALKQKGAKNLVAAK